MEEIKVESQVGVKIILKSADGKVLLIKRNPEKYPEVGPKWDIVGGRINPGTPLLDNLKREIKEEISLDLVKEPKLIAAQDILKTNERHIVRLTYVGRIDGEPKLDDDHIEYRWFTLEEMSNLELKEFDHYVKELLEKNLIV